MWRFGLLIIAIAVTFPAAAVDRPEGAVGDGLADDTVALQRAIDDADGGLRLAGGVYRITRPLVIDLDRVGPIAIIGDGTTRLVMAGAGPALKFVGTHEGTADPESVKPNVWQRQRMPRVEGIEIVGDHALADGIEATGTMQLTLTGLTVRNTRHAVHLIKRNRNVIVAQCHLYENRGVGLYLDDVNLHQINVSASHISYNDRGGIVVRAGNVRNLHVSGCDIEGNMPREASTPQVEMPPTANILIDATGGSHGTAEVAITGCTIQHSHASPGSANIRFLGRDASDRRWGHLTITGNVLSDVQRNIDIQHARGVAITGNTLWKGVEHDIHIADSSNVVLGPNVLDRNPQYQDQATANGGIVLRNCHDCTLTGLHVQGVRRAPAGILLENCHRMNIVGCTILDCDTAGLLLKNVTAANVSGCLIRNDLPDAEKFEEIVTQK